MAGPLIAGTLTTLLVFGPIVFVRGLAAALFRDLSLACVMSVAASLILALTLMPVMMAGAGEQAERADGRTGRNPTATARSLLRRSAVRRLSRLGHHLAELYERGMIWSLDHPRTVFAHRARRDRSLAVFVALRLPREILPQVDEGIAVASLHLPEGTAIEETARQAARLEAAAAGLGASGIYSRDRHRHRRRGPGRRRPGGADARSSSLPVPAGPRPAASPTSCAARCPTWPRGRWRSTSPASRSSAA